MSTGITTFFFFYDGLESDMTGFAKTRLAKDFCITSTEVWNQIEVAFFFTYTSYQIQNLVKEGRQQYRQTVQLVLLSVSHTHM